MKLLERFLHTWAAISFTVLLAVWVPDCAGELWERAQMEEDPPLGWRETALYEGFRSYSGGWDRDIGVNRRKVYRISALGALFLVINGTILTVHRKRITTRTSKDSMNNALERALQTPSEKEQVRAKEGD